MSISINQRILEANEEIKNFNHRMMTDNATLQDVLSQMQPSPDLHAAMVKGNLSMLQDLAMHASANAAAVDTLLQLAEESNAMATRNAAAIAQHRKVGDSCVLSSSSSSSSSMSSVVMLEPGAQLRPAYAPAAPAQQPLPQPPPQPQPQPQPHPQPAEPQSLVDKGKAVIGQGLASLDAWLSKK